MTVRQIRLTVSDLNFFFFFKYRQNPQKSTHQNTDTSFLNQETLTGHRYNPPTVKKFHNKENSTNCQNTERPPQTQQYKQDEETEEYPAGKGTG